MFVRMHLLLKRLVHHNLKCTPIYLTQVQMLILSLVLRLLVIIQLILRFLPVPPAGVTYTDYVYKRDR